MARRDRLYMGVVTEITSRIHGREYRPGEKLPSEPDLAEQFNVSRSTIREALGNLEVQGLIARRHGIGSFVVGVDDGIGAGLERMESFTDTIRRAGHSAEDRVISIEPVHLGDEVAAAMRDAPGAVGYEIKSLRFSDGTPVIFTVDTLRGEIVRGREDVLELRRKHESLLSFLQQAFGIKPCYSLMNLSAVNAPPGVALDLQVSENHPLVRLEGVVRDREGSIIYHSVTFFRSDKYRFLLVRRS